VRTLQTCICHANGKKSGGEMSFAALSLKSQKQIPPPQAAEDHSLRVGMTDCGIPKQRTNVRQAAYLRFLRIIARGLGRAPSHSEFFPRAGISRYEVARFFPKWNDAVRAAGLEPRKLRVSLQDSELLRDWGETARRKRALPSWRGYLMEGKYDPRTLEKRSAAGQPCGGLFAILPKASGNGRMLWPFCPLAHQSRSADRTTTWLPEFHRRKHGTCR